MTGVGKIRAGATAAVLVPLSLLLAGCGKNVIKPHGAEQSIVRLVSRQTGFRPVDVRCPDGVEAKAGVTFACHFTGPHGRPYTARMRVTKVRGKRVIFYIRTRPTG